MVEGECSLAWRWLLALYASQNPPVITCLKRPMLRKPNIQSSCDEVFTEMWGRRRTVGVFHWVERSLTVTLRKTAKLGFQTNHERRTGEHKTCVHQRLWEKCLMGIEDGRPHPKHAWQHWCCPAYYYAWSIEAMCLVSSGLRIMAAGPLPNWPW